MDAKLTYPYYIVQDMDAALNFYQNALGLKLKFRDGSKWAELTCKAGNRLALASAEEGAAGAKGAVVCLEAAEVDAAITEHGGAVLNVRPAGSYGEITTLRDPSGNFLQVLRKF